MLCSIVYICMQLFLRAVAKLDDGVGLSVGETSCCYTQACLNLCSNKNFFSEILLRVTVIFIITWRVMQDLQSTVLSFSLFLFFFLILFSLVSIVCTKFNRHVHLEQLIPWEQSSIFRYILCIDWYFEGLFFDIYTLVTKIVIFTILGECDLICLN